MDDGRDKGIEEQSTNERAIGLVQAQARAEMARSGLSQIAAAKQIGMSSSALNQWLHSAYKGDNSAVDKKVRSWIEAQAKRRSSSHDQPVPLWVQTSTSRHIEGALTFAQFNGDLAVIYGVAGAGKTETLKRYAEMNPNVWGFTASPAARTVTAVLQELAELLGLRGVPQKAARLHAAILSRMRGTQGLLSVDEAQHLPLETLEALRSIHDATNLGLALCGNETVYARLTGGSRAAQFAQLFSRVGRQVRVPRIPEEDILEIARAWGVTQDAETEFLLDIGQRPGALRSVTKTLRLASMLASSKSEPIGMCHLKVAWRDLGGES